MSSDRCYFLDVTNHIAADHFVECETDDLAQARADELLADTEYPAIEVWDGARFVYEAKRRGRGLLVGGRSGIKEPSFAGANVAIGNVDMRGLHRLTAQGRGLCDHSAVSTSRLGASALGRRG